MGSTHGPYILQLCMGPSYFSGGLTPPDPLLFCTPALQHLTMTRASSLMPA